jgi:hypothetical protein
LDRGLKAYDAGTWRHRLGKISEVGIQGQIDPILMADRMCPLNMDNTVRIPGDGDQRSELMSITIPK